MKLKSLALVASLAALIATPALARDQIKIVGSSTVFPFSSATAEQFGAQGTFQTPVVESLGTGGGFKAFCAGAGLDTPDITNASRRIKKEEYDQCKANGVGDIVEVTIGFDGIVLANSKTGQRFTITRKQIFLALAKEIPFQDAWTPNFYQNWNDIDASLPALPIEVYGPPPTSGTRDAFAELVMEAGCKEALAAYAHLPKREKGDCHPVREDGRYIEAGENDNLIVQKLIANANAVGIFGYSFLEENADQLQGSMVDGIEPTYDNISGGTYPVSRSLFFYVKTAHIGTVPGIKEFTELFVQESSFGPDGFLADKGLIALPDEQREAVRQTVAAMTPLSM